MTGAQDHLPGAVPVPPAQRFHIYRMAANLWAVHDSTKPYGSRCTFVPTEQAARDRVAALETKEKKKR